MVLKTGNYENPTNIKAVGIGDGKWAKEEVPGPYCGRTGRPVHLELDLIDDVQRRHELFLLDEGEKKVEHEPETRKSHPPPLIHSPHANPSLPGVPNAALFTFNKEDHTLGNLLRAHLAKHPHVLFAGYQVPHPLFATFKLRVQTDGEISPKEAVVGACQELVKELQMLDQEFTKEWELKKIAVAGGDV